MWNTFFAVALAASVWFCAANLAVQLNKDQALASSVIERQQQISAVSGQRLSAAEPDAGARSGLQLD
jgi:hypothetical protein